jgi:hypothetical protein
VCRQLCGTTASVPAFRRGINTWAVCLVPATIRSDEDDGDVARLFVSDSSDVHELDLARGQVRSWSTANSLVTGLAAVDNGARVFVAGDVSIDEIDTRTGTVTTLATRPVWSEEQSRSPRPLSLDTPLALWWTARQALCSLWITAPFVSCDCAGSGFREGSQIHR